jgi:hypothetical protein
MSDLESSTKKPGRQINKLVILGFLSLILITLLGVVFIPWDVPRPEAPDLELKQSPVPTAENAFTYFEAAGKLQVQKFTAPDGNQRIWSDLLYNYSTGKPSWDPAFADEVILANAAAFTELEKGIACQCYQAPFLSDDKNSLRWLQPQRLSAQLLNLKSKRNHLAGDYVGAVKTGLQGLRLGQMATDNSNSLLGWLIGIACEHIALARLEELAADAKTPESVLREILAVLDQKPSSAFVNGFKNAFKGEHQQSSNSMQRDVQRNLCKDYYPIASRYIWIPYAYKPNMSISLLTDYDRILIANADRPYVKLKLDFPERPQLPTDTFGKVVFYAKPNGIGRFLFAEFRFNLYKKGLEKKCQLQASIAALQLKIALRLYEMKLGQLPDNLNALVPDYLPEIPKDPYDDQPFRYSKTKKKVWAVGSDLIDHGGKAMFDVIMTDRSGGYDLVMPLDPRDPNPPPAAIPPPATTR